MSLFLIKKNILIINIYYKYYHELIININYNINYIYYIYYHELIIKFI